MWSYFIKNFPNSWNVKLFKTFFIIKKQIQIQCKPLAQPLTSFFAHLVCSWSLSHTYIFGETTSSKRSQF